MSILKIRNQVLRNYQGKSVEEIIANYEQYINELKRMFKDIKSNAPIKSEAMMEILKADAWNNFTAIEYEIISHHLNSRFKTKEVSHD